jgi:hypothetical protein
MIIIGMLDDEVGLITQKIVDGPGGFGTYINALPAEV